MKQSGNRLRLKIKKKETNEPLLKHNVNALRQKRSNPFLQEKIKKIHKSNEITHSDKSILLNKLDSVHSTDWSIDKTATIVKKTKYAIRTDSDTNPSQNEEDPEETPELIYSSPLLPLDWSIKKKIQLISKEPLSFCSSIKSIDKAVGIKQFASNDNQIPHFYQYLCNWIHPLIPGVQNFPLKRTIGEKMVSGTRDENITSVFNNNHLFQEAILQQWKISFQSLFNMMKSNFCPYFYLCGHQFSVLFKSGGISSKNMRVILTPTTKGLRSMLTEESISFVFTYQDELDVSNTTKGDDEKNRTSMSDSEYDADSFLNSLGLNKDQHFPNIEEQRKLSVKSELKRLDNRPESTIEIKDGQGFFNFLINSPLLCAPSGSLIGIPPTLISPVVFEGAACHINKYTHGKIKQKSNLSETFLYSLDIYGFILPTELKGIIDLQLQSPCQDFNIRTRGYENLFAFNSKTTETEVQDVNNKNEFLNQISQSIPDQNEVQYVDKLFKF